MTKGSFLMSNCFSEFWSLSASGNFHKVINLVNRHLEWSVKTRKLFFEEKQRMFSHRQKIIKSVKAFTKLSVWLVDLLNGQWQQWSCSFAERQRMAEIGLLWINLTDELKMTTNVVVSHQQKKWICRRSYQDYIESTLVWLIFCDSTVLGEQRE